MNRVFLFLLCRKTEQETELRSSGQEGSPLVGKNTGIVLESCPTWKCIPTTIPGSGEICEVPGCHLLQQMSSQLGTQNLLQGLVPHELTAYLSIFNLFYLFNLFNLFCPYYQKHVNQNIFNRITLHNSRKLRFTNI